MKSIYRLAGFSVRVIEGHSPKLCVVVELQHRASGELYHHHKDFPFKPGLAGYLQGGIAGFEMTKIADGKTPPGWELQSPTSSRPTIEELERILAGGEAIIIAPDGSIKSVQK